MNKPIEEIVEQLSDLYLATITGKLVDEDLFCSLVTQLKREGYTFEPLYHVALVEMYERQDKQLEELAYFVTVGKRKRIVFVSARGLDVDGWIWSNMHTNIEVKVERLNQLYCRIINDRFVDEDIDVEQFKNLIKHLRGMGYYFRLVHSAAGDSEYFQTDSVSGIINFTQGGHKVDKYVLLLSVLP